MTTAPTRQATGTPIRQLFEDADRMAKIERDIQSLASAGAELAMSQQATLVAVSLLNRQVVDLVKRTEWLEAQMRGIGQNDSRLSAILGSIQSEIKTLREGIELMP